MGVYSLSQVFDSPPLSMPVKVDFSRCMQLLRTSLKDKPPTASLPALAGSGSLSVFGSGLGSVSVCNFVLASLCDKGSARLSVAPERPLERPVRIISAHGG
jgi:hypothetical protein